MKGLLVIVLVLVTEGWGQPPEILWTSELRGGGNWLDFIRTRDGGFAVGSATWPDDGRRFNNMIIQKTDTLGQSLWLRFYAQSDSNYNVLATWASSIHQMSDGGYILAGMEADGGLIVRTDSLGETIWMKSLPQEEYGMRAVEDCDVGNDGNIVVVGDDRAVKLDDHAEGEVIWARSFDRRNGEQFWDIKKESENGFLLSGVTYSIGAGSGDIYVVRIDDEGEIIWRRSYGTQYYEGCSAATQTLDGGWGLASVHKYGMGDTTFAMAVKIDENGEEIWSRIYSEYRRGNLLRSIAQTPDSGFVFGGHDGTASTFLLIRTDQEGEAHWRGRYRTPRGAMENCISIFLMEDGSYTLGGANSWGACLIRTKPDTTHLPNDVVLLDPAFPSQFDIGAPYPNPFNSTVTIRFGLVNGPYAVSVYGLDGRVVAEIDPPYPPCNSRAGLQTVIWNAAGVPAGQYIIKLASGNYSAAKTVTLIK